MPAGHLLLPAVLGALRGEAGAEALGECRKLYEDAERDWGDSAATAMQAGTYTKARHGLLAVLLGYCCMCNSRPTLTWTMNLQEAL